MVAPIGLGIVGLGTAGVAMLASALHDDAVRVVAVADPLVEELPLSGSTSIAIYRSLEALLEDRDVEVVHLATPTPLHAAHIRLAVEARRHVVVEKPVTARSDEVPLLGKRATDVGVAVIVGHSESFEPYAASVRVAISEGRLGTPVAVMAEKVTDWMRRPRRPEELDASQGGGIIRRQGVHQVDVVRSVVFAKDLQVSRARLIPDAHGGQTAGYVAWLDAPGGTVCLLQDGRGVRGMLPTSSDPPRQAPEAEKRRRAAALLERAVTAGRPLALGGGDVERFSVLGTEGRLVASSRGVAVERGGDVEQLDLASRPEGRAAVLEELRQVLDGKAPLHDLAWGAENLRLCEAIEEAGTR